MERNNIRRYISEMARSQTAKDSLVVLSGNLLTAGLGFLAMVIVSRTLGPYQFGVFSVVMAVMTMIVGLADLGIGTSLVKFTSLYLKTDRKRAELMLHTAFDVEVIISLLILVLGVIFAGTLSRLISTGRDLALPLRLAFLGAAAMSMGSYIVAVLQSWQAFLKLFFYSVAGNFLKLLFVLLLLFAGKFQTLSVIAVYALVPLAGLVLGMFLIPRGVLRSRPDGDKRGAFWQLFSFSKWIMLSYLANTVITRIDVLILARYRGAEEVGVYAVAYQLSQIFPIIMGSLITVLLPQVSRLSVREEFVRFIKKSLTMSVLVVLALIPAFVFSGLLIRIIFGTNWAASSGIFRVLFVNFMINIICNPLGTVVFALNRPMVTTYTNFLQMGISVAGNLLLIPLYGGYGAAYTFLFLTAVGSLIITTYVLIRVYQMEPGYQLGV